MENITFEAASHVADALSENYNEEDTANEARAKSAWRTIEAYADRAYGEKTPVPVEQGVRDFLGDLQHLCDKLELDFQDLLTRSTATYQEEVEHPLG